MIHRPISSSLSCPFFLTSICLVWQLSGFVLPADPAQHPAHLLLPGLRPLIRFSFGSEFEFFCSEVCNLQHPNHPSEDVLHHQPPPICLWAPPRQYSQIQYVKANILHPSSCFNKLASLEAILVGNSADPVTDRAEM